MTGAAPGAGGQDDPMTREDVDLMALDFLERSGGDSVGTIDTDDKLAAAIVFMDLEKRGFARSVRRETGPFYTITEAGRGHLRRHE